MTRRTGALVGTWRGDAVGYRAMHQRLGPVLGLCVDGCGRVATEWSLNVSAVRVRVEIAGSMRGRRFSTDPAEYSPRCYRCHALHDGHAGGSHRWAKLTEEQVQEIRSTYTGRRGEQAAFARRLGVSKHAIWRIVHGHNWRQR